MLYICTVLYILYCMLMYILYSTYSTVQYGYSTVPGTRYCSLYSYSTVQYEYVLVQSSQTIVLVQLYSNVKCDDVNNYYKIDYGRCAQASSKYDMYRSKQCVQQQQGAMAPYVANQYPVPGTVVLSYPVRYPVASKMCTGMITLQRQRTRVPYPRVPYRVPGTDLLHTTRYLLRYRVSYTQYLLLARTCRNRFHKK